MWPIERGTLTASLLDQKANTSQGSGPCVRIPGAWNWLGSLRPQLAAPVKLHSSCDFCHIGCFVPLTVTQTDGRLLQPGQDRLRFLLLSTNLEACIFCSRPSSKKVWFCRNRPSVISPPQNVPWHGDELGQRKQISIPRMVRGFIGANLFSLNTQRKGCDSMVDCLVCMKKILSSILGIFNLKELDGMKDLSLRAVTRMDCSDLDRAMVW